MLLVCLCALKDVCFVVVCNLMLYDCVCLYVCVCVCVRCLNTLVWLACDLMCAAVRLVFLVCVVVFCCVCWFV